MKEPDVRKIVRAGYGEIAKQSGSCCGGRDAVKQNSIGCGCGAGTDMAEKISQRIGYSDEEIAAVPDGANLGLGCGNPIALASLKPGEIVLDLGSGAGFDCFLAASRVSGKGKVIGVDMTPEMLDRAKENAAKGQYKNVEFRLGEIENLPVADSAVNVIISNCVINLSPDKKRVFQEAFRVLKPSGRLMVSDIVILKELPDLIKKSIAAYIGCLSGAISKNEYLKAIKAAGFKDVKIVEESIFPLEDMANDPTARTIMDNIKMTREQLKDLASSVASIKVSAVKPE
jgi:arsenite methyltransferase